MPIIEANGLVKDFGGFRAVDGLSFSVEPGEIVALLGANGAGKTTTMRMLTGYFAPSAGTVAVAGHDTARELHAAQSAIGYLPETPPLYPEMTVRAYLAFAARLRGSGRRQVTLQVTRAMEQCWLTDRADWVIGNLSRGYRQRVGLAQAILTDPQVLILDEPTSGLDPEQILMVRELIGRLARDRTVLFSTHILAEAERVCHRALILKGGRLVADEKMAHLLASRGCVDEVEVAVQASKHEVEAAFGAVSGVRAVAFSNHGTGVNGWLEVRVQASRSAMLLSDLSRTVIDRGWPLHRMAYRQPTLEEVFLKLTGAEPGAQQLR